MSWRGKVWKILLPSNTHVSSSFCRGQLFQLNFPIFCSHLNFIPCTHIIIFFKHLSKSLGQNISKPHITHVPRWMFWATADLCFDMKIYHKTDFGYKLYFKYYLNLLVCIDITITIQFILYQFLRVKCISISNMNDPTVSGKSSLIVVV